VRPTHIAARVNITERSAFGIITDLAEVGYVVEEKDGRRNRYHIQASAAARTRQPGSQPSARSWPCWSASARPRPEYGEPPRPVRDGFWRPGPHRPAFSRQAG